MAKAGQAGEYRGCVHRRVTLVKGQFTMHGASLQASNAAAPPPRALVQAQLTGPCSLCGSNRSSSCWRRLPSYTGDGAGQAACE